MTDTLVSAESEAKLVADAVADFLQDHDPTTRSHEEFRGHQFDHSLAWVHFSEGNGGLGIRPNLQKSGIENGN